MRKERTVNSVSVQCIGCKEWFHARALYILVSLQGSILDLSTWTSSATSVALRSFTVQHKMLLTSAYAVRAVSLLF